LAVAAVIGAAGLPDAVAQVRPTVLGATIHWESVPLSDAAARIRQTYGAAVFVDRRLDPSLPVNLDIRDATADVALRKLAATNGIGCTQIGDVFYLGPAEAVESLRTLAALRSDDVNRLPSQIRMAALRKENRAWPKLAEPRALVREIARERGLEVDRIEAIPHDLWRAGSLPALSLPEQLTIVLSGYDLTFHFREGKSAIEIVPIERPVTLTRRYRLRYGASEADRLLQQFRALKVAVDGDFAAVTGRIEDHEQLGNWFAGPRTRSEPSLAAGATKQLFTLRAQDQPVRTIIAALIERLNWRLEIDEKAIHSAGLSLDRRVTFQVQNGSQDELLNAVLKPIGLDFAREGERIIIIPGNGDPRN
jgi:hypothetical protein